MQIPEIVPVLYQFLQKTRSYIEAGEPGNLCNSSNGPIVFLSLESDQSWKILSISPNVTTKWGYTPEEIAGHNLLDFIHPDDIESFLTNNTQVQAFDHCLEKSYRFRYKNRGYQRILCYIQQTTHAGYVISVTEAQTLLGRLLQDRQQIQSIIDSVPLFCYTIQNNYISFWQGQGLADLGLKLDEFDNQSLDTVTAILPALGSAIQEAKEAGRSSCILALGEYAFQNHTTCLDPENIYGVCLDVTEAEQVKKESEQFAYSASHDLKQPLRGVANYNAIVSKLLKKATELLEKGHSQEAFHLLNGEVRLFMDKQKATAVRMDAIIDGLLELSRAEDAPIDSHSISEIIADVLDDLSGQIEALPQPVNVEIVTFLPSIQCNRTHVRQIFQNLISNAIKYRHLERNCVIQIGASPVVYSPHATCGIKSSFLFKEKPCWKFWVIDNGIGVPAGWEARIFQPFKSAPNGASAGIGMGLAIVQKIINQHKGRIWFNRPENNEGSEFFFVLPQ